MTMRTGGRGRRFSVLPIAAALSLGIVGCDSPNDDAGITEEEFAELESRVGTLEDDYGVLQEDIGVADEDIDTLQEELGLTGATPETDATDEEPEGEVGATE